MGLGSDDFSAVVDDRDGGGGADVGGGGKTFKSVSCSICLEIVADDGNRSWIALVHHSMLRVPCNAQIVEKLRKASGYMHMVARRCQNLAWITGLVKTSLWILATLKFPLEFTGVHMTA